MNNTCSQCGVSIPSGQKFCSMCYGDPYYGHDGYYLSWLEDEQQRAYEIEEAWKEQQEQEPEGQ